MPDQKVPVTSGHDPLQPVTEASSAAAHQQTGGSPPVCVRCARPLHPDEIALTRKLINRGASHFFCLSCLAARFEVPESALRGRIRQFREMGCTLFDSSNSSKP